MKREWNPGRDPFVARTSHRHFRRRHFRRRSRLFVENVDDNDVSVGLNNDEIFVHVHVDVVVVVVIVVVMVVAAAVVVVRLWRLRRAEIDCKKMLTAAFLY